MSKKFTGVYSGGQNIPVYDKDAHSAIEQKLDTSAFQSVSGNFLTAVPDAYATKEYANSAANAAASGKLDEDTFSQVSGDFLTAVPQSYLQNTDLTVTSGKVTEISGIPLSAGGGTLPDTIPVSGVSGISVTETENEVLIGISADFATSADLEKKLDTSAFSSVSGNFLTAVPENYATKEYLSGQISGKYDTSSFANVSGDFLTAVPESAISGFATHEEVESATSGKADVSALEGLATETYVDSATSGKQDTLEFGYDENSAISGINGSALAGGSTPDMSAYVPYSATSVALGNGNSAAELGFALGSGNQGPRQGIAVGQDNKCSYGACSLLVGGNNSAYEDAAAIGWSSYAGYQSFALGVNAEARGSKSFALGDYVSARRERDFVLGSQSYASGESLAQGYSAAATQDSLAQGSYISAHRCSLAQGSNSLASSDSLAQGGNCTAKKFSIAQGATNSAIDYAQTFGQGLLASGQMSIGKYNKTSAGAAFVIGDGSWSERSDAFIINKDGSVSAKGNISANGVELGGIPEGVMQTSGLEYDGDKISGYMGSAFKAGDELPSGTMNTSGLEYNAVNEISGYNGSAIAQYGAEKQWLTHDDTIVHVSNSAQYAFGVNMSAISADLARMMGVDETVLYSGLKTVGNAGTATYELNESPLNFDRVKVLWVLQADNTTTTDASNKGIGSFEYEPNTLIKNYNYIHAVMNGNNSTAFSLYDIDTNLNNIKTTAWEVRSQLRGQSNNAQWFHIYKIVGINRISGGN